MDDIKTQPQGAVEPTSTGYVKRLDKVAEYQKWIVTEHGQKVMALTTFADWLNELDAIGAARGYKYPVTDAEGWDEYYQDGYTPKEALDEDESCAL